MATELFGLCAVLVMLIAYALEARAPIYVLIFAAGCAAAAVYAVEIRSWPFAGVEAIWSVVAVLRWRARRSRSGGASRPLDIREE